MNQKQWNNLLTDLKETFERHGFSNRAVLVQGQSKVEADILKIKENPYDKYDSKTYGSTTIYEEYKRTGDLKLVWARMSASVKEYQLDPVDVAKKSPDYCPVTGAMIDYGYGFNRVTDNPYFRPGIDHIDASGNGGNKYGDITNIQIVSAFFNTIKSYGTKIDAIKWVFFELCSLEGINDDTTS